MRAAALLPPLAHPPHRTAIGLLGIKEVRETHG